MHTGDKILAEAFNSAGLKHFKPLETLELVVRDYGDFIKQAFTQKDDKAFDVAMQRLTNDIENDPHKFTVSCGEMKKILIRYIKTRVNMEQSRVCIKCDTEKEIDAFKNVRGGKKSATCKQCIYSKKDKETDKGEQLICSNCHVTKSTQQFPVSGIDKQHVGWCNQCVDTTSKICEGFTRGVERVNSDILKDLEQIEPDRNIDDAPFIDLTKKPPLGIVPRYFHDKRRFLNLKRAIGSHIENNMPIQQDWIEEYNEIVNRYKDAEDKDLG